jgi:WD40 repeat protein
MGICSGHTQGVGTLAFSPDGKTLASSGSDGTLRLWNVATQQQLLAVQQVGSPFFDLLFSPDGSYLIAKKLRGDTPGLRIFEAPN